EGVQLAADRVHRRGDVQRGALARALEQQVLKVVSRPRVRLVLVPRADANPDAECYRPDGRKELGDHAQAARKDGPAHGRLRVTQRGTKGTHLVAVPATRALPDPASAFPVTTTVAAAVTVTAVTARAVLTPAAGLAAAEVLARRLALDHLDGNERQLAAVVDLADLHLDLVAHVNDVLDVLDPPAAVQLADLRDVQQAVLAGQQRKERTERRRLHDRA